MPYWTLFLRHLWFGLFNHLNLRMVPNALDKCTYDMVTISFVTATLNALCNMFYYSQLDNTIDTTLPKLANMEF